ncbi:MAG: DNA repair protein [Lachnospiraceae bacterium]|nr:DNA repair protein [Lachnospiraceae bacterium]
MERKYICIDLKSFYASVECAERGLDAMKTNLIVADLSRSEKTICLAITPPMKAMGISSRCRVFEIPKNIEYIAAPPRMQLYINYAAEIYRIYLKYISKDDIHVYSIDEAFMDVTEYLSLYKMTARELGKAIISEIYEKLHIRATCGIGTNLYLTKIALDISAKHSPDFIGELDEETYKKTLWNHRPLKDFWKIGSKTEKKLNSYGIYTMKDIANADEDLLYKLFGIDAELLIDHSKGIETVTIQDIKMYKPSTNSLSNGQVLPRDYSFKEGELIIKEMMDLLCLEMVQKNVVSKSYSLYVGYSNYIPEEPVHGSFSLLNETNADVVLIPKMVELYNRIVDEAYPVRRINISANSIIADGYKQLSIFDTNEARMLEEKNHKIQEAVLKVKEKYGKNSILKGMNLHEEATTIERNNQIGGHKA